MTQIRNDSSGHVLDNLTYHYAQLNGRTIANRLYHVNDSIASNYSSTDIDDQGSYDSTLTEINSKNNYSYDAIGQLVKDKQEQIDTIYWSVYGKIRYIKRSSGSPKPSLSFDYDASGNRIAKNVFSAGNHSLIYSDYYVRDAQGNQLAIYRKQATGAGLSFELRERNIFGSSLVGTSYDSLQLIGSVTQTDTTSHYLGKKNYFLENHLSNILSTISDKKIPQVNNATDTLVGYYGPLVMSSTDYSAFGVELTGRNFNSKSARYGMNGQEKDDEIEGSGNFLEFKYRGYDPRLGRFTSVDPLVKNFAGVSPYVYAQNRVIDGRDFEGKEYVHYYVFLESDGKTLIQNVKVEDFRGMSNEQLQKIHGIGSEEFYKKYSESFGKEGRGVKYSYFVKDNRTGRFISGGSIFESSGGFFSHGLYYGAGGPSQQGDRSFVPPGSPNNKFTYSEKPIDEVDALARSHDMNYEKAGVTDFHSDPKGIPADLELISELESYLERASQKGYKDAVTGKAPSKEAITSAKRAIYGFKLLMGNKLCEKHKEEDRQKKK